ncbi:MULTISPECIES: TM2 domain-containing protein [Aquimarina]|uniref:TM2 domain-containing protein n=1 Tax=Aquimarina algiphila TaxID=2047982 RepID=A0A554VIP4_9FLAO|nr:MULTISPECIES: TM2 domain-containing protein [Aquimarina]TSE07684.1 TM2 domain-containing protein [Aquimarina algiphila]
MSEENNNLGDDIKKGAEEAAETVKDAANDFADGAKEVINSEENKKMIAGILAIIIGSLGIHKFYLGYTKEGIIQIVITFVTCGIGSFIGLIEGIIYLTKSDDEFYQTYQVGRKPWF